MNKKTINIILIVVLALLLLVAYNQFFAPQTVEGEKSITIEIVIEPEGIETLYEFNTDALVLYDLLIEHEEELVVYIEGTDYGPMLMGLEGYNSNPAKNEYYHILVNGEDGLVGIKDQPVNDGDIFRFELRTW